MSLRGSAKNCVASCTFVPVKQVSWILEGLSLRGSGKISGGRGVSLAAQIFSGARTHTFFIFYFYLRACRWGGRAKFEEGEVFSSSRTPHRHPSRISGTPAWTHPRAAWGRRSLRQYLYFCTSKASTQTSQSHFRHPSMDAPSRWNMCIYYKLCCVLYVICYIIYIMYIIYIYYVHNIY